MTSWADEDLRISVAPLWPPAPPPAWGSSSVPVQPRETPTSEPDARPPAPVQKYGLVSAAQRCACLQAVVGPPYAVATLIDGIAHCFDGRYCFPISVVPGLAPSTTGTVWVAAVLQTVVSQKVNRLGGQLPAGGGGRSAIAGMFSNQVETFETTSLHVVAVELSEQAVREAYQNWPGRREGDELVVVEKPVGAGSVSGEVASSPAPVSSTYPCARCHERMLTVGSYCPPCREEYLAECRALDPDPGRE